MLVPLAHRRLGRFNTCASKEENPFAMNVTARSRLCSFELWQPSHGEADISKTPEDARNETSVSKYRPSPLSGLPNACSYTDKIAIPCSKGRRVSAVRCTSSRHASSANARWDGSPSFSERLKKQAYEAEVTQISDPKQ